MLLKISLLFQSILPLIFIVFCINSYSLICDLCNEEKEINFDHYVLLAILIVFLIIIILTIISFFLTKSFIRHGEELPKTIKEVTKSNEIGLKFFMTYIVPLIMVDLTNIGKIVGFMVIFIIMIVLIIKTDLHFVNPILIFFGYNLYIIKTIDGCEYKCMCRDNINLDDKIIFKKISKNLIYGRKYLK